MKGGCQDDESKADWLARWKAKGDLLEARLATHGKKFVAGTDTITLADFTVAGSYFANHYNDQAMWGPELKEGL